MGTMYGASLKQETQAAQREEERAEESRERRLERLRVARERLEATRVGLERKIGEVRARREGRAVQRGGIGEV